MRYTCEADLPRKAGGDANEFLAPLWAARKIGYLLQEIRLHGENEELIAEVVRLSKKFGIVTEYTEFLAMAETDVSSELAVNETRRLMERANTLQAGQWAVNQARNDKSLQNRTVATQDANGYIDRRGNLVFNGNIRQLGRQAFYYREGQWVDAEGPGDRKTRVVKLFSEEYMELLRNNPQFARAPRFGWAVSINVDDERIVVEKDGKQKSEQLQNRQMRQNLRRQDLNQFQSLPNQLQQIPQNQLRNPVRNRLVDQQVQARQGNFQRRQAPDVIWGEASHGLKCAISVPKPRWSKDGPAMVSVLVQNVSGTKVDWRTIPAFRLDDSCWGPVDLAKGGRASPANSRSTISLNPGEILRCDVDLAKLRWDRVESSIWPAKKLYSLVPPGKYSLGLNIEITGEEKPRWVRSGKIPITVTK